jgi:hypothetical protein
MTVSTALNKIIYAGNASTTTFPFSFPGVLAADVQVFFTDINGIVTLLATNQYGLVLNPPIGTNPTGIGGTITYNPLGVPIPLGTFLTIMRTLPLLQTTTLKDQGTLYQQVIEAALDYGIMVSQQVLEIQSRALVVGVSDSTPSPLPAAASRALKVLGFDVSGNPIAVSTAPLGVISSAMSPVVGAATLAAGRTAFGLGSIATEGIGSGLQDDGASNVRTYYPEVSDSIAQSVVAAFHANIHVALAAVTYTFPLTSTLWNGFGFWIYATTAAVTLAINAADTFLGAATGASLVVPPGSRVFVSTNAAGTWYVQGYNSNGFNAPINLQINASVAGNALTISLKDANGNDPSASSPIIYVISSGGNSVPRAVTGPLSITIPNGATIGTVSAQASRLWVGLFDNSVLGVYDSLSGMSIKSWDETSSTVGTAISAGATSAQTWYTASGVTAAFRIIGFVESNQPVAGVWTVAPSKIQLFGPGIRKPGDVIQDINAAIGASDSTSSTTFVAGTNNRITLSVQGAPNVIRVEASGTMASTAQSVATTPGGSIAQLSRGTTANSGLFGSKLQELIDIVSGSGNPTGFINAPALLLGYDIPGAGSVTYAVQLAVTGATTATFGNAGQSVISAREIQV